MVPAKIKCNSCGAEIKVSTYRKFVVCPYCSEKIPFPDLITGKSIGTAVCIHRCGDGWTALPVAAQTCIWGQKVRLGNVPTAVAVFQGKAKEKVSSGFAMNARHT